MPGNVRIPKEVKGERQRGRKGIEGRNRKEGRDRRKE
jgi:hypothetical protein